MYDWITSRETVNFGLVDLQKGMTIERASTYYHRTTWAIIEVGFGNEKLVGFRRNENYFIAQTDWQNCSCGTDHPVKLEHALCWASDYAKGNQTQFDLASVAHA